MIIDAHNHADWYGHDLRKFLINMEKYNIDKTWILTWECPSNEYSPTYNRCTNINSSNIMGPISFYRCLSYIERAPDKFILGYAPDPRRPDAIDMLESAINMYDVKVYGELKLRMMWDNLDAIRMYRFCGEKGLPVIVHVSSSDESSRYWSGGGVDALERAIIACPNTNFLGHAHGFWQHISGEGKYNNELLPKGKIIPGGKLIEMLNKYPNLYCDLSAGSGYNALSRDPEFTKNFLVEFQDRVIYGRDYFDDIHKEFINSLNVPADVMEKVYSGNALKLISS